MKTHITFNLFELVKRLEIANGRTYEQQDIASLSGIHRGTVARLMSSQSRRIDYDTLAALIDFFAAEGMPVTVGDLLRVEQV